MKVSVIVPIYKVEAYIEHCARSLFEQTLQNVEFIFVDDATPDDSIAILEETIKQYPQRRSQVKIIHHSENKGLPTARNSGLQVATGEYIFHCDSDDYVDSSAFEKLYEAAVTNKADYVWCDWYLAFPQSKRYMQQLSCQTSEETLRGVLAGGMKYNVWNKLVKRSLYIDNDISFPDGYGMGEDMTMIRLLACAKHVTYVPSALYYYVKREGEAFTNTWTDKHIDSVRHNTQITIDFLKQRFSSSLDREIAWFKLNVKLPFVISNNKQLYKLWTESYPEANKHIWTNKQLSWRIRLLQLFASRRWFYLVRLHYALIYKLIYGIIFK